MENLEEWIEGLKTSKKLIIVEGLKDKTALESFGINKILTINKPFYKIIEDISENCKECVLLVDLDKEGKKLYKKLKINLEKNGVKIDNKFREFLFKTKLRQIEGLTSYIKKL